MKILGKEKLRNTISPTWVWFLKNIEKRKIVKKKGGNFIKCFSFLVSIEKLKEIK